MIIDEEKLRNDLIDLIGPATTIYPVVTSDLVRAECADDEELVQMASSYGININNYEIDEDNN